MVKMWMGGAAHDQDETSSSNERWEDPSSTAPRSTSAEVTSDRNSSLKKDADPGSSSSAPSLPTTSWNNKKPITQHKSDLLAQSAAAAQAVKKSLKKNLEPNTKNSP
jgi:hypothetical protein